MRIMKGSWNIASSTLTRRIFRVLQYSSYRQNEALFQLIAERRVVHLNPGCHPARFQLPTDFMRQPFDPDPPALKDGLMPQDYLVRLDR